MYKPDMEKKLTKEEKRAVRKGKAYKSWWLGMLRAYTFGIVGMLMVIPVDAIVKSISNSEKVEIIIVLAYFVTIAFFFLKLTDSGWHCPKCDFRLPRIADGTRAQIPKIVLRCPNCDYDLTDGNLERIDE